MFSLLTRLKRKILRLFKVQSESRQVRQSTVRSRTIKFFLLALISVMVAIFYPGEQLYDPLDMPRRGEVCREDITAASQIVVYKTEQELAEEREVVRLSVPYVVDHDAGVKRTVFGELRLFFEVIDSLRENTDSATVSRPVSWPDVAARFPSLDQHAISQSIWRTDLMDVYTRLQHILRDEIYRVGVLADRSMLPAEAGKNVLVRTGERENIYPRNRVLDLAQANAHLLTAINRLSAGGSVDADYYYLVGRAFIRPSLQPNPEAYRQRLDEELATISNVKEVVYSDEVIVRSGTRVTERQQRILQELAVLQRAEAEKESWLLVSAPVVARLLMVTVSFIGLYLLLYYFRRDVFNSNARLLALLLVFALQLTLVYMADRWDLSVYLFPVAILPMMVTILYDAEVGIFSTLVLALLLGMMHRFNFSLCLMTVAVGIVACFTSQRVRRRSHFVKIMISVSLAYAVFVLLVESMMMAPGTEFVTNIGFGLINGMISVFLTIGLLPLFESLFGITTDITLLELSDLNHPLLKRLALEAPGTFQHSLNTGNLCEAGAKAIGGNSLLARVGAYYHDIGKMEIPEYYVENQLSLKSKHESLTPSMSAIVLATHLKKGRALGEEAGLPDDVLNFIEEHHGTMVMTYFYDKAIKQGADPSTRDKYRYPGPKPQIRETGIAMLADAAEAASRTLDKPTPARINGLIQRIINDRFESGELSECPLTLRDLAGIKNSFAQILIAAFHQRVVYPTREKAEEVN
ncbi:MAG: HDIG domain-containing metalloprotein [bacterium]